MAESKSPTSSFLLPEIENPDTREFWERTAKRELCVQKCGDCGKWRMPPRPMCPHCRSIASEWVPTSGRGAIWSFIVPHPPLLPAYAELAPYNVIVVALDEDPSIRFVGNLVTSEDGPINEIDPQTIQIGERVTVVFAKVDDVFLPRWRRP